MIPSGNRNGYQDVQDMVNNNTEDIPEDASRGRALVVVFSYHHNNTEKIARAIAGILNAPVKTPRQVQPEEFADYDLVGFGSGIYSAGFDPSVLELAGRVPDAAGKKAFLFSTFGAPGFVANREFVLANHNGIREKLRARGYSIVGEFGCAGWNTNSFLKYFGGLNRGRPDATDLKNAEAFAREMLGKARR